ncbi:HYR domain-containing protein [Paracrocinitomix mangrovi]|uniref:HYR domain-containing protein n=1 Tax=Paracrocinitomix mangrovi TaxID=2862509 RepID=UPI001EDA2C34|nr:HYR domain-containing protein [Paracrocinitomix mangrovi]UKN02647.1 HYR domain-containing protein [Paracrocinitomix mangrovi]
MRKLYVLLGIIAISISFSTHAQVPTCGTDVPYFQVDLTGQPDGVWESPSHSRLGNCCGTSSPDRCTSFEIILDTGATMINFEIASGAIPPGSMFYQIGCGPQVPVGDAICISGVGPHYLTFCKPGNNENTYRITSIPKPTFPKDDSTRIGCTLPIEILGLENITINSISPGTPGQYNSYLSCLDCGTPNFEPGLSAPAFIDYEICGTPTASACGYVYTCDTVRLYAFQALDGSVTPNPAEFCSGGGGVVLTASATGGDAVYSYEWYNSSSVSVGTGSAFNATTQENFTVKISDGLVSPTCPSEYITVPVTVGLPPTVSAGIDQTLCANDPEVFLSGSVTNADGAVWTGGTGTFNPNDSTVFASYMPTSAELTAGSVTLTLTSYGAGGGCTEDFDQVTIFFSDTVDISFTSPTLNCYNSTGALTANASSGTAPYTYFWSTGATTNSIFAGDGTYWVEVTDAIGCSHTESVTLTAPSEMNLTMSSTDCSFDGASDGTASVAVAGGTPAYTYSWGTGGTAATETGLSYGVATVTVTDANGCIKIGSVVVNEPQCLAFSVAASSTNVSCFGGNDGTASAVAAGGLLPYSYSWNTSPVSAGTPISGLSAGTYTVTATDGNGCVDLATVAITEPTQLTNTMTHTDIAVIGANTGVATANPSGGTPGYSYLWTPGGETTQSIINQFAGTYYVDITDSKFCSISDSVIINEPPCNNLDIGLVYSDITCNGASDGKATVVVAHGTAPYTITWSDGQTGTTATNLSAGSYTVTVTDASNCTTFENFTITEPSALSVGLTPTAISCFGYANGTIDLTATGGTYPYSFSWEIGGVVITKAEDLVNLKPGTYSVTVTDANGCVETASVGITQPAQVAATATKINALCNGDSNGSIDATSTGGTAPHSYLWQGPLGFTSTSQDISSLSAGLYTLQVTDLNGCTLVTPLGVYIDQPDTVIIHNISVSCPTPGATNANVVVDSVTGGTEDLYDISYDNGTTFNGLGNYTATLPTGATYQVVARDANACATVNPYVLTIDPVVTITNVTFDPCIPAGATDIPVTVAATGGDGGPYEVSTDNGATFNAAGVMTINLAVGNSYNIVVRDAKGCLTVATSITIPNELIATGVIQNEVSCLGESDGSIDLTVTGGTTAYTFAWTGPNSYTATTEDISGLFEGTYDVIVTDANGCTANESVVLTTFVDVTNPTITCPSDISQSNDAGVCGALIIYATPVGVDNCPLGVSTIMTTGLTSGSTFPIGTTLVTYEVTDSAGNTASCSFNVTINDTENPTITCPADVTVSNDAGTCESATVTLGTPTTGDNCGVATVTNDAPATFPVGTTTVTWTVTDINGNSATCTQDVTVNDNENPTITCPADVTVSNDAGVCSATGVTLGTPTTGDNCGVATVINDAPATFPVGTTTVTWTVTDIHGNSVTCTQDVTVNDTENPTITCPTDVTVNNDPGNCSTDIVNISLGNPTTGDNCGVATVTNDAPATFPVGTTTVTWTVTDIHGNTATCTQDVTVNDNEDPIVTCPADVTVDSDAGLCEATTVTLGTPTTSDNCGVATVTNDAPATFPVGTTTVTWTITDIHGNSITCAQDVTVNDNENPTITCPADVTVSNDAGVCSATGVTLGTPTTGDNCGVATVTNDAPATFPVGTTTVTWTVTDIHGNSVTCTQDVTVNDTENPTITCPTDVTVNNDPGNCSTDLVNISLGNPTTGDNCGVATVTNDAPATFPVGTTTVTWTVTDIHGNTATCTQDVTVNDNEDPSIICPGDVTVDSDAGLCEATTVNLGTPFTNDNCGVATVTNDAPATFPVGTTTVTWTVTDIHGNSITCAQDVTVNDNENPTITCPADVTVSNDAGVCSATGVTLGTPTTGDNCGVATVTNDAPATFPVGTTTVTWTVTDIHGNSVTCTQDVTVNDTENPTITCPTDVTVNNDPGNCSTDLVNISLGNPTTGDNCGVATVTNDAPATFPVGTTTVTWTVTDIHGNTATCTQDVTVNDNEDPTLTCAPDQTEYADNNCEHAILDYTLLATYSDNCGATISQSPVAGTLVSTGDTTIVLTVIDNAGNTVSCSFNLTVLDTISPVFSGCPSDILVNSDPGNCSAVVSWTAPTSVDNCGDTITSNFSSGDTFPVGTTTVVYVATDLSGNTDTCSFDVVVTDNEAPVLTFCQADTSSCDSIILYDLPTASDNCGVDTIIQTAGLGSGAVFPVGTTTETYEVTDIHGNVSICSFTVTVHPKPTATGVTTDVTCFGLSDGSIDLTPADGTAPYTFLWSNAETTEDVTNLGPGDYSVTVYDANLCQFDTLFTVAESDTIQVDVTYGNVSCFDSTDAYINIIPTGGTMPYMYNWSNGDTLQNIDSLSAGIYDLTLTDDKGCIYQLSVEILEPDSMFAVSVLEHATCLSADGSIDLTLHGGTLPYTYNWSTGDTLQDIDSLAAGTYSVLVTDVNGCFLNYEDSVYAINPLGISHEIEDVTCYGDESGSIDIEVTGAVSPVVYNWSNGDTTALITNLVAGNYYVTVTDSNGCVISDTMDVYQPDSLYLEFIHSEYDGGFNVSHYLSEDGWIDMSVIGGVSPYSYTWSNGSTDEDIEDLTAGLYTIVVTDANGCSVFGSDSLIQPLELEMPQGFSPNGDGYNDYFVIHGIEVYPNNELLIYNRWGNLVYSTTGYNNDWEGLNNKGKKLPDGTYFAILKIDELEQPLTGYIDLRTVRNK